MKFYNFILISTFSFVFASKTSLEKEKKKLDIRREKLYANSDKLEAKTLKYVAKARKKVNEALALFEKEKTQTLTKLEEKRFKILKHNLKKTEKKMICI